MWERLRKVGLQSILYMNRVFAFVRVGDIQAFSSPATRWTTYLVPSEVKNAPSPNSRVVYRGRGQRWRGLQGEGFSGEETFIGAGVSDGKT